MQPDPTIGTRLKAFLAGLTAERAAGISGLALLCAATLLSVAPVLGVAALPTALAAALAGIGGNVSASLLQTAFQRSAETRTPQEEQRLVDLARSLEPAIAANTELRQELGAFLETHQAVEMAYAVLEGNPTHGWLLVQIYQGLFAYRADFDRIHQSLTTLKAALDHLVAQVDSSPSTVERITWLNELMHLSRARCIARWQAADVPRALATELVDDLTVGAPTPELQPTADQPLRILLGELGAGKSLFGERMFQAAVRQALTETSAPIPIYLEASKIEGALQPLVEAAAKDLGNLRTEGAFIVIDGADEAGVRRAGELLDSIRTLVAVWPNTSIVLTSRPLYELAKAPEGVQVPLLTETEQLALINRFADPAVEQRIRLDYRWPESIKDAIKRPLFAVLLGTYLRDSNFRGIYSPAELISEVIQRALRRAGTQIERAVQLLQRLAFLSTDRDNRPVPTGDIATPLELQPLLESRLVVESKGFLSFPLPMLTQWFAAHSLLASTPSMADLLRDPQRLERWRYALSIAAGIFGHDPVSILLQPLVEQNPAFAAEIIRAGSIPSSDAEDADLPSVSDCGTRVLTTMQTWTAGIGPLARLIAPVVDGNRLAPLGVGIDQGRLFTSWYYGTNESRAVFELAPGTNIFLDRKWCWTSIGRPRHQPGWAWEWSLEPLVSTLSQILKARALPLTEGPLLREEIWARAVKVTGHNTILPDPIPLTALHPILNGEKPIDRYTFQLLKAEADRLSALGETELRAPWPPADQLAGRPGSNWILSFWSDEQLLAHTIATYTAALEVYQQWMRTWFASFAPRMGLAATLPARLTGVVLRPRPNMGLQGEPSLEYYVDPLPKDSTTGVDFHLSDEDLPDDDAFHEAGHKRLQRFRPEAAEWLGFYRIGTMLEVGLHPVRELAYSWLWDDLERSCWVTGFLGMEL